MPRLYNLLGAAPLVAWYGWGLSRETPLFMRHFHALGASGSIDALAALQTFAQGASLAFIAFLIVLLLVRDVPQAQHRGLAPYAAALVGTFAVASLLFLPVAPLPAPLLAAATLCVVVGLCLSLYTLIFLGRSFAILPSARSLVTDGPYRLVRHPLYLFEEIVVVGIMLQFAQPWAALVVALHFTAQLIRMRYEEQVLTQTFPAYAAYAARTARLIPGVY